MSAYEDIKLEGHIIDSLLLPRVLDDILERGGEYRILRFKMGREKDDPSQAVLRVTAPDEPQLDRILRDLQQHGVELVDQHDARLEPAPGDGVFPEDFYSTTNLETFIRLQGRWITVNWPIPAGIVGSQRMAARVTFGGICLRSSSHLPLKLYSNCMKPVAFPPGCARLSTKPEPTGSGTMVKTIGTVRVS